MAITALSDDEKLDALAELAARMDAASGREHRPLDADGRAALLERLRATQADTDDEDEEPEPEEAGPRWLDLGRELDELPDDDPAPGAAGFDALARLFVLLAKHRPAWQADALCQEHPEVSFFPERGESTEPAKAICAACPCATECKGYAEANGIRHGIWAGESMAQRKRKRKHAA